MATADISWDEIKNENVDLVKIILTQFIFIHIFTYLAIFIFFVKICDVRIIM